MFASSRRAKDLCQPSIDILRERCIDWFRAQGIQGPLFFPDCAEPPQGQLDSGEPVEVIFFGSFLRRFLESAFWYWTPRRYRFWVLSYAARDVMVGLLGVPPSRIGVIPRYELFPAASRQRWLPDPRRSFTLVYSGRISPSKNIEMLLRTVSSLQTEQGLPAKLLLYSRFDHEGHADGGSSQDAVRVADYRKKIRRCVSSCKWTTRPRFIENRGPEDWFRDKLENPVLVSLSTFIGEDFGVSIAQAQARGWPCLLSDWGAHRDVQGPGVRKLPVSLIVAREADSLAALIRATLEAARVAVPVVSTASAPRLPTVTRAPKLDLLRRSLVERLGEGALSVSRGSLHEYGSSAAGARFFSDYRRLFS